MQWVTREHLHMDRVATPWLIQRFIDPDAEFLFLPFAPPHAVPDGAIAFGIPGVGLGAHDETGSAFSKVMRHYGVANPALERLAEILESGILFAHARLGRGEASPPLPRIEGAGLDVISLGMGHLALDDTDNLVRSRLIYDALYEYCRAAIYLENNPQIAAIRPPEQWAYVRAALREAV